MTTTDIISSLKNWKLTKYKVINLTIGISALLIYEFIGLPIYRPYIYANNINDFHIADTLGNSLGTVTTIFILLGLLSDDTIKGNYLINVGIMSLVLFELAHPLLGKSIDIWDIPATILTGFISYFIYNCIFEKKPKDN
jgi:hypothetical protein